MNIFVLDREISRCARYHCDRHVSKMILEGVQITCTALNKRGISTPYRSTHARHPCVLWAGASLDNMRWLLRLVRALNGEYRFRYRRDRDHASIRVSRVVGGILSSLDPDEFEHRGLTEFAQAMPESYRVPGDAVAAYRAFYMGEKASFARWTRRRAPHWWRPREAEDAA